mmetsp:Transcript_10144/g.16007  ORF Transcript_10144/g.16007 Transcript_10144/m.16007 type:complete len:635 (-) Transcript_10144:129-2033(-)
MAVRNLGAAVASWARRRRLSRPYNMMGRGTIPVRSMSSKFRSENPPARTGKGKAAKKMVKKPYTKLHSANKKICWQTLSHNGIAFPPEYQPHGLGVLYDGEEVKLDGLAEEMATSFAEVILRDAEGETTLSPSTNPLFLRNMWMDWSKALGASHRIQSLSKVDFTPIVNHLRDIKKGRQIGDFERDRKILLDRYGYATVDGNTKKVAKIMVESPGWYVGLGGGQMTGRWRPRVRPEDVTLNLSSCATVPRCPVEGHNWGSLICKPSVMYIAKWTDPLTKKPKFVHLKSFKADSDMEKFNKARELKNRIKDIRKTYMKMLQSKDEKNKQLGTSIWLIDNFALRIGWQKDMNIAADTVGVVTLRKEHMRLIRGLETESYEMDLNFLGRCSVEYHTRVKIPKPVWNNLKNFLRDKSPKDLVFDKVSDQSINKFLKTLIPGLSAEVFRTLKASERMIRELGKPSLGGAKVSAEDDEKNKLEHLESCTRLVAKSLNNLERPAFGYQEAQRRLKVKVKKEEKWLKMLRIELKEAKYGEIIPRAERRTRTGSPSVKKARFIDTISADLDKQVKVIQDLQSQLDAHERQKQFRISKSKRSYIDPRIIIAWCKRMELSIECYYPKGLRAHFSWAMNAEEDFEW